MRDSFNINLHKSYQHSSSAHESERTVWVMCITPTVCLTDNEKSFQLIKLS